MEEIIVWAKTILSVYRYLEKMANAIDKIVQTKALNSFFVSGANCAYNNALTISQDIINLTERKVSLINLKVITEKALELTKPEYARLLILNYIEKRTCYECSDSLKISLRTYFRKMPLALKSFGSALIRLGFDEKYIENLLKSEQWILETKNKFETKKIENFEMDSKFEKQICLSFKRQNMTNLQIHNNLSF